MENDTYLWVSLYLFISVLVQIRSWNQPELSNEQCTVGCARKQREPLAVLNRTIDQLRHPLLLVGL